MIDKWLGDIPDRYKDTTPVEVKVDYVTKAEKRLNWRDLADVEQLQEFLQPRIDNAGRMAAAWERYLISECIRMGVWRIWFVQWCDYERASAFMKTKVFAPWDIKAAQALARKMGEHVVGLNLKRWLLYTESAFDYYSGSSPNRDMMAEMRRVMRARCIMKCMKPLLRRKCK